MYMVNNIYNFLLRKIVYRICFMIWTYNFFINYFTGILAIIFLFLTDLYYYCSTNFLMGNKCNLSGQL